MSIKKADINDLPVIQGLNHKLFVDHTRYDKFYNPEWPYGKGEAYFKKALTGRSWVVFLALEVQKPVGYLAAKIEVDEAYVNKMKIAEIKSLFIEEDYRNKKIGSSLMAAFKLWAKEKGANRLWVDAERDNENGVRFYKKHGFDECCVSLKIDIKG